MTNLTAVQKDRETFAAYVCDDVSQQLLKPIITERGWSSDMIFQGGIVAAVRALGAMPCPEFLLIDISDCDDPRADVQALADVCEEGTVVLAIGNTNDISLYRDLLNAGVHDYIVKPLSPDLMRATCLAAEEALQTPEAVVEEIPVGDSHTVIVLGVRGGLGASALAANIAWLKASQKQSTALLDLDLYFGTSAMQFDLEPGRGLADALENPSRVDSLFLERAVVKPNENLAILCAEAAVGSLHQPTDGAHEQLINAMAENYQNVVIDLPRHMLSDHSDILAAASDIIMLTDYSLFSARDCIRLKAHIKKCAPNARLHLVANKASNGGDEVEEKDFENSIEHGVCVKIPGDEKTALLAAQNSTIVSEYSPNSKLTAAYKGAAALFGPALADTESRTPSWLGKLIKK